MRWLTTQHSKRRGVTYVGGAVAIYLISLTTLFYLLMSIMYNSPTYVYHTYRYGSFYTMYMNLHAATLLLFTTYLPVYVVARKLRILHYVMIITSITLIITNYSYLILYSITKNVSLGIYPLLITLTSNQSVNTVVSFDWGQPAIVFLAYHVVCRYLDRSAPLNKRVVRAETQHQRESDEPGKSCDA